MRTGRKNECTAASQQGLKGGNMTCQQTSYLERELVHGVDFIEVVHYEVQQGRLCCCWSVVLPSFIKFCLCPLSFFYLQ